MSKRIAQAVWFSALLTAAGAAGAEDQGREPWEKGSLQIGGFIDSTSSEIQLDSKTLGVGTVVDLEDGLGVDADNTTYRIDALYRPGSSRRHQVEAHYYRSDRDGSRVLAQDYQIGDHVFPAGSGVTTSLHTWFLNIDYSYAFLQDERVRFAVAGGLHTTGIKFKVASTSTGIEQEDVTAPLPVVGLRGEVVLTPRWRLKASADVFYIKYQNFRGSLLDTSLAVEYLPFKHVGFGLGLNAVRFHIEADSDNDFGANLEGTLRYDFVGALLYAKFFF